MDDAVQLLITDLLQKGEIESFAEEQGVDIRVEYAKEPPFDPAFVFVSPQTVEVNLSESPIQYNP